MALIAGVTCLTLAAPAGANSFLVIQTSPDAWTVIDPATVARDPGGSQLTAWSVTVQRNLTNSAPPQPGYVRTLNNYDCQQWRVRWRTLLAYSRFGALVMKKDNAAAEWEPVANGGPGDADLRLLCGAAGGRSVVAAGSIGQLVIGLMQAWDPPGGAEPDLAPPPPTPPQLSPPPKSAPRRRGTR